MGRITSILPIAVALLVVGLAHGWLSATSCAAQAGETLSDKPAPVRGNLYLAQQPAKKTKTKSQPALDEALLKDLDNELLDGAGDLKCPANKPKSADDAAPGDVPPIDGEDIGMPSEDADPLHAHQPGNAAGRKPDPQGGRHRPRSETSRTDRQGLGNT